MATAAEGGCLGLQEFERLYKTLKAFAVPLGPAAGHKLTLFYRHDLHSFCRDGCHDPTKFEPLLRTLPRCLLR